MDQCLIAGSAPVDKIVDVLSDEQVQKTQEYRLTHNTPVELRDIAIVLLGLKTGLRACDILSLRFQDINWKKCQISIVMKKTKTQITLPMPVEVGNAIYSYLKYGRPDAKNDFIFVRSKAPYGRLTGKVCTKALYRILPERKDVKSGGFHVTRRTFATNLLKNRKRLVFLPYLKIKRLQLFYHRPVFLCCLHNLGQFNSGEIITLCFILI